VLLRILLLTTAADLLMAPVGVLVVDAMRSSGFALGTLVRPVGLLAGGAVATTMGSASTVAGSGC
jgi:hypothetical protein